MGKSAHQKKSAGGTSKPLLTTLDNDTDIGGSFKHVQLYDDMAMMEMKTSICQGYITLLTGGIPLPEQPKKKKNKKKGADAVEDPSVVLAFASLTTGNVIDACFGVSMSNKGSAHVQQLIKETKAALFAANDASERAPSTAVDAYKAAFKTVIDMNKAIDKLNFFTRCLNEGKLRKRACKQLELDFAALAQIVADNK